MLNLPLCVKNKNWIGKDILLKNKYLFSYNERSPEVVTFQRTAKTTRLLKKKFGKHNSLARKATFKRFF